MLTINISNLSVMPFLLLCGLARGETWNENREEREEVEERKGRERQSNIGREAGETDEEMEI